MPDYIILCRFTEKGITNLNESPKRIQDAKKLLASVGAKVKAIYAVLGQYDVVWIIEAADDETMAKISLKIASFGNVHIETLRAFNEDQYLAILNKLA